MVYNELNAWPGDGQRWAEYEHDRYDDLDGCQYPNCDCGDEGDCEDYDFWHDPDDL